MTECYVILSRSLPRGNARPFEVWATGKAARERVRGLEREQRERHRRYNGRYVCKRHRVKPADWRHA